jgi:hypothetical protein
MWSSSRRARAHVADASPKILGLDGAVRQRGIRGNALSQFMNRAGNIEDHPVQNVVGFLLQRDIRIVQDQSESDGAGGNIGPLQFGETAFGSLCVNRAGISPPSENAEVVSVNPGRGGILACLSCAIAEQVRAATRTVQMVNVRMRFRITGVAAGRQVAGMAFELS